MNGSRLQISRSWRLTWLLGATLATLASAAGISVYSVREHAASVLAENPSLAPDQSREIVDSIGRVLLQACITSALLLAPLTVFVIWSVRRQQLAWQETVRGEKRLAATLRSIGDAVVTTDSQGRVLLMNEVAQRLCGWPEQEAQGRPIEEIVRVGQGETLEPIEDFCSRVAASDAPVKLPPDCRLLSRDGTEYLIDDSGAGIRDADGSHGGFVFVFRDVTRGSFRKKPCARARRCFA